MQELSARYAPKYLNANQKLYQRDTSKLMLYVQWSNDYFWNDWLLLMKHDFSIEDKTTIHPVTALGNLPWPKKFKTQKSTGMVIVFNDIVLMTIFKRVKQLMQNTILTCCSLVAEHCTYSSGWQDERCFEEFGLWLHRLSSVITRILFHFFSILKP